MSRDSSSPTRCAARILGLQDSHRLGLRRATSRAGTLGESLRSRRFSIAIDTQFPSMETCSVWSFNSDMLMSFSQVTCAVVMLMAWPSATYRGLEKVLFVIFDQEVF